MTDAQGHMGLEPPTGPPKGLSPHAALARIERAFGRRKGPGISWVVTSIAIVWFLAGAYYLLTPSTYVSRWTLILPVSNNSSTISVDTIGYASTNQAHTFGSVSLSPKVIYREIANSEQVRQQAAHALGIHPSAFPRARIKLIDETSLMQFQMTGRSPEDAQARARALVAAFQQQLDILRRDEAEKRAASVREHMKQYQANLEAARQRIVEFQNATGLRSINQFNETVSSAEMMRRKLAEMKSELDKAERNQSVLKNRVGLSPRDAAAGLKLAADPAFAKLLHAFSDANSILHEHKLIYGPNHPAFRQARFKRDGALAEFQRIARSAGVDPTVDVGALVVVINGSQQADLLRNIVAGESLVSGLRREVETMQEELARVESEIARLGPEAAKLENLKKDHLVAEAVYSSAVARLDTSKTDLYSSYPIVQLLSEPDRPQERSQPQLAIALVAAVLGSALILVAWGVTWARAALFPRRPRRRSSTGPSSEPGDFGFSEVSTSSAR